MLLFIFLCINEKKTDHDIQLSEKSEIIIYPDEIKFKDDWMNGKGYLNSKRFLLSGKVTENQKRLIQSGIPLLLKNINAEVKEIEPATNFGEFDYQKYYQGKKIFQRVKVNSFEFENKTETLIDRLHFLRFNLQNYFAKMPKLLCFFSHELILAESPDQEQEIISNYRDLGIIHLLSISGLHVSLYLLIVSTICYLFKWTEEETFIVCSIALIFCIFLSHGQAGFVRASLTYFIATLFKFKNLKIFSLDILGMACIVHLIISPRLFMNTSAILSYLLALGLQITGKMSKFKQGFTLNLLLLPLLLIYFFQVNLLTNIFNLLAIPYFNFIVIPIVFINLLIFPFIPEVSIFAESVLSMTENFIGNLAKTKIGLLTFGKINWWQSILLLLMTIGLIVIINETKKYLVYRNKTIKILLISYLILFSLIHFPLKGEVIFIDVGQGDSILITTPFPRRTYLIDTGGKLNFTGKKMKPQVDRITIPLLKAKGISKINGLFVSHQDADHVGDIKPLMQKVKVEKLFMAQGLLKNPSFRKRVIEQENRVKMIELIAGMQVHEPKINFEVVYPFHEGLGKNEDSLCLTFKIAGKRWLFTGDLGQDGEKEILQKYRMKANYFKLGHHGSKTASNPDFLQNLAPDLVFISAGRNNRFGHPHPETLATLKKLEIPWVSTQDCGMISWYYDKRGSHFERFIKEGKE